MSNGTLRLRGEVLRIDGSEAIQVEDVCQIKDGSLLSEELAERIIAQAGANFFCLGIGHSNQLKR